MNGGICNETGAEGAYRALIANRRVALVGPSKSIAGSGYGREIESYDFVVRMNHQWPIDSGMVIDIGSRMDVLYHCCNGDYSIASLFNAEFSRTRFVCFESEEGNESLKLADHCRNAGIPALDVSNRYQQLRNMLKSPPNTGLVAITHLLDMGIAELGLFGMTFFRESYYPGYSGDGASQEVWSGARPPNRIWEHDLEAQFSLFKGLIKREPRLKIDPTSQKVMLLFGDDLVC